MCQTLLTDFFMAYMSPLGRGRFARLHVRFSAFICAALVIVDLFLDICDIILNYITNPLSLSFDEKNLLLAVYLFPVGFAIMRVLKGKASKISLLKYAYPANLCLSCVNVQQAVRKESRRKKFRKSEQSQDKYMQAIQATQEANRKLHEVLKVEIFGEAMPQLFLRLYFAIRCAFRVGVLPDGMTWIRVAFSSFSICGELYNLQTLRDQCYCMKRLREVDVPDSSRDAPGDQQKALLAGDLRPYRHNLLSYIVIVALSVPYCLVQTTVWALVLNSSSTLFYSCLVLHGGIFWALKFYFSLPGEIPWSEHPMPVPASLRYIFSPYSPDFHVEVAKENSSVAWQHIIFLLFGSSILRHAVFGTYHTCPLRAVVSARNVDH
ncbi:uncharacterized protein LOC129590827 [Paramacrobiotus metropolitanus]|uniref:uncharacterized protein LOC129590827 n=1 Tax=Paramacrobiotus metropolitanus TaxID=2943436 RepID=UPI00244565F5|nr:uncharacterized protein LOC129590827 [Paramacrobiotus metropolitanus]